eukprot:s3850_g7.t1
MHRECILSPEEAPCRIPGSIGAHPRIGSAVGFSLRSICQALEALLVALKNNRSIIREFGSARVSIRGKKIEKNEAMIVQGTTGFWSATTHGSVLEHMRHDICDVSPVDMRPETRNRTSEAWYFEDF